MTPTLITRDDSARLVSFNAAAKEMRTRAMMLAVEIEAVTDPESQAKAVEAQQALTDFAKAIEDCRKVVKQPVLDYARAIDNAAKEFVANPMAEQMRIARMVGNYQGLELAKQRAAEAARNEELTRLEREKHAELAKANTFEQREVVHERFQQQVEASQAATKIAIAPRVEGQIVKEEWEFDVTDKRLLAQMHPHLVNIEPRRSEIKEELKLGHKINGVEGRKVIVAGVRASKAKELTVQVI